MPSAVSETIQYQAALAGNMFMAGSGALTFGLLSYFRATIANPSSNRIMLIHQVDAFSTVSATFAHLWLDPTNGLPSGAAGVQRPVLNCNVNGSNTAGVGIVKAEIITQTLNTAMSGGTDTGIDLAIGPSMYEPVPLPPIILRPGHTLGMGATIAAAVNLSMIIRWSEQAGT